MDTMAKKTGSPGFVQLAARKAARVHWEQDAAGSNSAARTISRLIVFDAPALFFSDIPADTLEFPLLDRTECCKNTCGHLTVNRIFSALIVLTIYTDVRGTGSRVAI